MAVKCIDYDRWIDANECMRVVVIMEGSRSKRKMKRKKKKIMKK